MFRKTLLLTVLLVLFAPMAWADGEVIQFLLSGINQLSTGLATGGKVYCYAAGTTNAKSVYTTKAMTTAHPQPVVLDTDGRAIAYGEGMYKFVVKDQYDNTIFTVDNVEVRSIQGLFDDPTDPFGDTLTQTTLGVTNLTAASSVLEDLTVSVGASIASLTIGNTQINGVATGTTNQAAVNLGQLNQALTDYALPTNSVTAAKLDLDYAKFHRVATMTLTASDTWTDVVWDTTIASETTGIQLIGTGVIQIASAAHYEIGGCVRPYWTGADSTAATLASRVVFSTDGGSTWVEARCLQSVSHRARQANGVDTQHYLGSLSLPDSARIKLQVRVSSVQMLLAGWPSFDNPVAASINIYTGGYYNP